MNSRTKEKSLNSIAAIDNYEEATKTAHFCKKHRAEGGAELAVAKMNWK